MGHGKIKTKRIESSNKCLVIFSKRRNEILKKVREISMLCDANIDIVIFSSVGKLYDYYSPRTSCMPLPIQWFSCCRRRNLL
jgi:MADS-box transcription factor, plant